MRQQKITVTLSTVTKFLVFGGLLLIIVSHILLNVINDDFLKKYFIIKPSLDIVLALGTTLFSAGLVSIIIEISTIKGIVSETFNNILTGDLPLSSYSNDTLMHISKLIAAKCGNVPIDYVSESIYRVEPQLIKMLDGIYYNNYNAVYEIIPDEEQGVFKKCVSLEYEVINKFNKNNTIRHSIALYDSSPNMKDHERKKKYNISKLIINGEDLSSTAEKYLKIDNIEERHSIYKYTITFEKKLEQCESNKILIEYTYDVPISDVTQVFRMTVPCKSTTHDIYINTNNCKDKWVLQGAAFVSFYCEENNNHGFSVKQKHESNLQITFNDWCIPGAGYMVYLSKGCN